MACPFAESSFIGDSVPLASFLLTGATVIGRFRVGFACQGTASPLGGV